MATAGTETGKLEVWRLLAAVELRFRPEQAPGARAASNRPAVSGQQRLMARNPDAQQHNNYWGWIAINYSWRTPPRTSTERLWH
jgi:hypothetical protein